MSKKRVSVSLLWATALCVFAFAPATVSAQRLQYNFTDRVAALLEYPEAAYETMFEATIPIGFRVAADGTIHDVRSRVDVSRESQMVREMVDAAIRAVDAAPEWEPAGEGEVASEEEYSVNVEFAMPRFAGDVSRGPQFMPPVGSEDDEDEEGHDSYASLRDWISERMEVPEDFRVTLTGVIEKGGTLGHLKILSTSDDALAARVIELLADAPAWTPPLGREGQPVRAFRHIPLSFRSRDEESGEESEDVMPTFQGGGLDTFRGWVMSRLSYPPFAARNGVQGTVMLRFVVERDGSVSEIETLHSPNRLLTQEATRAVRRSPRWSPGTRNGETVRVYYILPIVFSLPG